MCVRSQLPNVRDQVHNILADQLWTVAGIRLHSGKTRVWNRAGECPPNMSDLGDECWNSDGIKVLGTPVGSQHFVQQMVDKRLNEERKLWDALTWVHDLQSAWQILLQCAGPRCHHFLRTLPPSHSAITPSGTIWACRQRWPRCCAKFQGVMLRKRTLAGWPLSPCAMGGMGLRSASRMAPGAFWASWARCSGNVARTTPSCDRGRSQRT